MLIISSSARQIRVRVALPILGYIGLGWSSRRIWVRWGSTAIKIILMVLGICPSGVMLHIPIMRA